MFFLWLKMWNSHEWFPCVRTARTQSSFKPACNAVAHWLALMTRASSVTRQVLTVPSAGNTELIMGSLEKGCGIQLAVGVHPCEKC